MLITLDGIVLDRREIGENSCFIDILTDEQGLVEAAAHGAKKINSSLLSSASLFSYSTFCLSKGKGRYTVNSAKPRFGFHKLGSDIEKLALASYFAQAMKYCTPSEQNQLENGQDSMVRFLAVALYEVLHADESEGARTLEAVKAAFELRYSLILGFAPNLVACDSCCKFEPECGMYFLPRKAKLLCADCCGQRYKDERVRLFPETLNAMRDIIFAKLDRCFKIRVSGDAERQLSRLAEDYFLNGVERSFKALEYFKKVRVTGPH